MSLAASRPPGLSTRAISRNAAGLSGTRLSTQLEITQSTEARTAACRSIVAWWNSTLVSAIGLPAFLRASSIISGVMSMPMALPVGPTFFAARNTSSPPPRPRSTTVSPGFRLAVAVGFPHETPMFASAGIDTSSSTEYPKASATARTPSRLLERPLVASDAYFSWTACSIARVMLQASSMNDKTSG